MNCDQLTTLLAEGSPLGGEARAHLSSCPACSSLAAMLEPLPTPPLDPAAEQRIVASVTAGLSPVRPLAASSRYVLGTMAAAAVAAAIGIALLGMAGWRADTVVQRAWFAASLAGGMLAAALALARLMAPGELLPSALRATLLLSPALLAAGALLYPAAAYQGFARAVAACLAIGLSYTILAAALILWIVRRGAFLPRARAAAVAGLLAGLSGAVVLFLFCPHRDFGHISLAHSTVPLAAAVLGASIARLPLRYS